MTSTLPHAAELLPKVELVVRAAGIDILRSKGEHHVDTGVHRGHEESTLDLHARSAVDVALHRYLPRFSGTFFFESEPYNLRPVSDRGLIEREEEDGVLVIDELEGTTNAKRALSASCSYNPRSCVSIALSRSRKLGDIQVAAVYMLEDGSTYSVMRVDDGRFMSFENGRRLDPKDVQQVRGDSRQRVMVIGYSNSFRRRKAELEEALWETGIKPYEGCRASGVDLISVVRNQFDAYIDLRSLWSRKKDGVEQEAMLQVYDIGGSLPIAIGAGLHAFDALGRSWGDYEFPDTIPLVVARPVLAEKIKALLPPLVSRWEVPAA